MKMVAAAKLRRAQEQAEAARPYAERMERMAGVSGGGLGGPGRGAGLLAGTGRADVHLLVVGTADRGLCGGFNSNIVRKQPAADRRKLAGDGKTVKILCVGRKGRDACRREYGDMIIDTIEGVTKPRPTFDKSEDDRRTHHPHVRGRRVRRLHLDLRRVQIGDHADPTRQQ